MPEPVARVSLPNPVILDVASTEIPFTGPVATEFNWSPFNTPVPVFVLYPDVVVRFTRYDKTIDRVDPQLYLDPFWEVPAPEAEINLPFDMEACIADGAMGLHWRGLATRSQLLTQPTPDAVDIGVGMWSWAQELIPQIQEIIKGRRAQDIVKGADDRAHAAPIGNRATRRGTPHLLG